MKKSVVFEFPDDFHFPEYFGQKNTTYEENTLCGLSGKVCEIVNIPSSTCVECPFYVPVDEYGPFCMLTGGDDVSKRPCPFYGGADTVNYNEY